MMWIPSESITSVTKWVVCYHPGSLNPTYGSWRKLPFAGNNTIEGHSKWSHLNIVNGEKFLKPKITLYETARTVLKWEMDDRRIGTWGQIIVNNSYDTSADQLIQIDVRDISSGEANNLYDSEYGTSHTSGSAIRLVVQSTSCNNPPNIKAEMFQGGTSTDSSVNKIIHSSKKAGYFILIPSGVGFSVCWKQHASNWVRLSDNFIPESDPILNNYIGIDGESFIHNVDGMVSQSTILRNQQSIIKVSGSHHSKASLSTSDVIRLVESTSRCDIRNQNSYIQSSNPFQTCNLINGGLQEGNCSVISEVVDKFCFDSDNCTSSVVMEDLMRLTPSITQGVIPIFSYNSSSLGTSSLLDITVSDIPTYKLCYKQNITDNWLILQRNISIKNLQQKGTISPNPSDRVLLGGELTEFTLSDIPFKITVGNSTSDNNAEFNGSDTLFYAKLVATGLSSTCLLPPAGTEGDQFASGTVFYSKGINSNQVRFRVVIPQKSGDYTLCIRIESRNTTRPETFTVSFGSYQVADNGIRWFISSSRDVPTNQAEVRIRLLRCSWDETLENCLPDANNEVFNTDPGEDMAKIILPKSNNRPQSCHEITSEDERALYANSYHVGETIEPVTDLGPASGSEDVATFNVILPSTDNDEPATYKVCVKTKFAFPQDRSAWVEISEARDYKDRDPNREYGFKTQPGLLLSWTISESLQPVYSEINREGVVGLAGANTQFVTNINEGGDTDIIRDVGFSLRTTAEVTSIPSIEFKLILKSKPSAQYPSTSPDKNNIWKWDDIPDAGCANPAVTETHTASPDCTEGSPSVSVINILSSSSTSGLVNSVGEISYEGSYSILDTSFTTVQGVAVPHKEWCSLTNGLLSATIHDGHWPLELSSDDLGEVTGPSVSTGCSTAKSGKSLQHTVTCCFASSNDIVTSKCPKVETVPQNSNLRVAFTLPLSTGEYYVCARVGKSSPWLWLPHSSGGYSLFTQPTYLEYDIHEGDDAATGNIFDIRLKVNKTSSQSLQSWCTLSTVNSSGCSGSLIKTDIISIIPSTELCPIPTDVVYSLDRLLWIPIISSSGAQATVQEGYQLPPKHYNSLSGRYKICIFKVSRWSNHSSNSPDMSILQSGISYQILNRGIATSGGLSGYYQSSKGKVDNLILDIPTLKFNSSRQFCIADRETFARFSHVPVSDLTTDSGFTSSSPVVKSGSIVEVIVRAASGDNIIPFGQYAVTVMRCRSAAGDWASILCPNPHDVNSKKGFSISNVVGNSTDSTCTPLNGPKYGWPQDGLKQFLDQGVAIFRLRYQSKCPQPEYQNVLPSPGCGVRFSASPEGPQGPTVFSNPYWVSVESIYPDGVIADSHRLKSLQRNCQGSSCFIKQCTNRQQCIVSLQAAYNGPEFFAPIGELLVTPIVGNMSSLSQLPLNSPVTWDDTGKYEFSFYPTITSRECISAVMQLNISYGNGLSVWSALEISVNCWKPHSVEIIDLIPLDKLIRDVTIRTPVDLWVANNSDSYIEALVPYRAEFILSDSESKDINDNYNWEASISLTETAGSRGNYLMSVLVDSSGRPTIDNFLTSNSDDYRLSLGSGIQAQKLYSTPNGNTVWGITFRILNNRGCSRWSTSSVDWGCHLKLNIAFDFKSNPPRPHQTIETEVITAVRVPASTFHIRLQRTTASCGHGIELEALPGTYTSGTWYYDEFHNGTAFAMLEDIKFPDGLDGDSTPLYEGLELLDPHKAHTSLLEADGRTVIGYNFILKTTTPCNGCIATIHSTWGAGPVGDNGVVYFKLTDDAVKLSCEVLLSSESGDALHLYDARDSSDYFTVNVYVSNRNSEPLSWPTWDVQLSSVDSNIVLKSSTSLIQSFKPSGAIFKDVHVEGSFSDSTVISLIAASNTTSYADPSERIITELTCSFNIPTKIMEIPPPPTTILNITKVEGATPLCQSTNSSISSVECLKYLTTTDGGPVAITVSFSHTYGEKKAPVSGAVSGSIDRTPRNITIITHQIRGQKEKIPSWMCTESRCETTEQSAESQHLPIKGIDDSGVVTTYTFGTAQIVISRIQLDGVTARGEGLFFSFFSFFNSRNIK